MVRVESEVVPLALFVALAVLFAALGVFCLLRPERAAAFFADEDARRPFRPRDARALGAVFALGGAALAAVGIVRLVTVLSAG
ncbi:hypothetical protein [Leifsonia sp. RAF41]|uniref:hypothetical protein n=1 Tax=Leifsonia sp. RAF41 TaxID=3233056 RepID=UPI003F9AE83F